jgi:ParB family chromosome partitioning protein
MMIKEIIGKILAGERDGTTLWKIPICEIEYQPVSDPAEGVLIASLAENILRCGLLQPILLYRENHKPFAPRNYRLISGRRRLEAMRMLGRTHIDGIVVRCKPEQIMALTLSDNLLCREPDVFRLATQIKCLLDGGMKMERLSSLLAIPTEQLQVLVDLLEWPPEDIRLLQLCGASRGDVARFANQSPLERRFLLERLCEFTKGTFEERVCAYENQSELIPARNEKVAVCDTRLFLNSVERAAETMKKSGYDTTVDRSEDDVSYTFWVRVSKHPGGSFSNEEAGNVSRETFASRDLRSRFSSASSIFEAIAEDEKTFAENVSRETSKSATNCGRNKEIEEKLELCIDGI